MPRLQRAIERAARDDPARYLGRRVAVRWLKLLDELQRADESSAQLALDEVIAIGMRCGLSSPAEVQSAGIIFCLRVKILASLPTSNIRGLRC